VWCSALKELQELQNAAAVLIFIEVKKEIFKLMSGRYLYSRRNVSSKVTLFEENNEYS
jgi:hypothetical protein